MVLYNIAGEVGERDERISAGEAEIGRERMKATVEA